MIQAVAAALTPDQVTTREPPGNVIVDQSTGRLVVAGGSSDGGITRRLYRVFGELTGGAGTGITNGVGAVASPYATVTVNATENDLPFASAPQGFELYAVSWAMDGAEVANFVLTAGQLVSFPGTDNPTLATGDPRGLVLVYTGADGIMSGRVQCDAGAPRTATGRIKVVGVRRYFDLASNAVTFGGP